MILIATERTYANDDYYFSITENDYVFTISMCSCEEYEACSRPEFFFLGFYEKQEGWTLEKIEQKLADPGFLYNSTAEYTSWLTSASRSRNLSNMERYAEFENTMQSVSDGISELKEELITSSSPVWNFEQAAKYSHIGRNLLRELAESKKCYWTIKVSSGKTMIKVEEFKRWIEETHRIK